MIIDITQFRLPKRWPVRPAVVGYLAGGLAFCVAMMLLSGSRPVARAQQQASELRPRLSAEMTSGVPDTPRSEARVTYGPWYPPGTHPGSQPARTMGRAAATPRREAPFTLMPDAPLLPSGEGFISLLGEPAGNDGMWLKSDYGNSDGMLGGPWIPENVNYVPEGMRLDLVRTPNGPHPLTMAEVQTRQSYGYGRYEAVMRIAKGSGLVSTFFTYTGKYQGTPHEEIDFEFLGRDTTQVHLNYWHNGRHGAAVDMNLPFDASEGDHLYAFEWKPEGIYWYVDGKLLYQTEPGDPFIPRHPSKIMFSLWTGKLPQWHGRANFGAKASAHYSCISYTPIGENTRRCSDLFPPPAD